jgi:hypothetical protein
MIMHTHVYLHTKAHKYTGNNRIQSIAALHLKGLNELRVLMMIIVITFWIF